MKARDINYSHLGWQAEAQYAQGILKWVGRRDGKVSLLVQNKGAFQGIDLELDEEVVIEKTLEDQVKDDLKSLKNSFFQTFRKGLY